jgi:hypothetical protein
MKVSDQLAYKVANRYTDDLIEAVEAELGIELGEEKWEEVSDALEGAVTEAIQEAFA